MEMVGGFAARSDLRVDPPVLSDAGRAHSGDASGVARRK
jgi:hypothetical protein